MALHALQGNNSNSPRRTGLQRVFARPNHLYTRRTLYLLRTAPLYMSVVATCHGTISREPKATTRTAPSAPNRPMTLPRSQGAPESPRTDRLQPQARAHLSRGASGPFTPSAPKVTPPHFRRRRPAPFEIDEGGCSCEATLTKLKQHQRYH
jgi:hypothetical protein